MTSRRIEDDHVLQIQKLLSESGLVCTRSPAVTSESSTFSGEEEQGPCEEEGTPHPEALEEEGEPQQPDVTPEEPPYIFPTPSLRRVLPDRMRKIEEQHRIYTIPEVFRKDIDPEMIPKIAYTAQQKYIEILAEMVGCTQYKSSLAEFWFLDTLANLLWRAQNDQLDRPTQAVLILWFCEWMKEMQCFDAADRERMLRRFKDNMLSAAKFIAEQDRLPTPAEAGVHYEALDVDGESVEPPPNVPLESKHSVTFEGGAYECSLLDLTKIIHYIFDLSSRSQVMRLPTNSISSLFRYISTKISLKKCFHVLFAFTGTCSEMWTWPILDCVNEMIILRDGFSSDYQYNLVRSVFTFTPGYVLIDAPYQIVNPKRLYAPLKVKKEKPHKKEGKVSSGKGKKKEVDTEEYLALMELKAREEKELDEIAEKDKETWNRRSHILPLHFAIEDSFFDKYWPPPPPEPEPEPEPEPKSKGKGKGKGRK